MLSQMAKCPSFSWLNNIPLWMYIHFLYLVIHWQTLKFLLSWFNKHGKADVSLCEPLDIYPEVGLLDHMVALFVIFWDTSVLFSITVVLIYIPSDSAPASLFSTALPTISIFYLFGNSHPDRILILYTINNYFLYTINNYFNTILK